MVHRDYGKGEQQNVSALPSYTFKGTFSITYVSTSCTILDIDGVRILTDPFFAPAGTKWDLSGDIRLVNSGTPALTLDSIPAIDAVLLTHEDHPGHLDDLGRQLLNGRRVFTTENGQKNLAPRPDVRGLKPWQSISTSLGGKKFQITAIPCLHLPGSQCIGFVLTSEDFGESADGRPNGIYFTGDTVYFDELSRIRDKFHIVVVIAAFGAARLPSPNGHIQVTMDGKQGAQLYRDLKADYLVPIHYDSWEHLTQTGDELRKVLSDQGIEHVRWLNPGKAVRIL